MKLPYRVRIVGALPGHPPIELARLHRKLNPKDLGRWIGEMSSAWKIWTERPLMDRETITARPGSRRWFHGRIWG